MTSFVLKLIALIAMTFDHAGYLIYGHLSWMNYIGRIAFPLYAFQISEGYIHTHNLKKYLTRLLLFAIVSQIIYIWFCSCFFSNNISLNILFTLILGLLAISIYNCFAEACTKLKSQDNANVSTSKQKDTEFLYKLCGIMCVFIIGIIAEKFGFDYGFYGIVLIFLFYLFREHKILMNLSVIILTIIYYIPYWMSSSFSIAYIVLFFFSLIPLIFIGLYNGEKGKEFKFSKIVFYAYYPIHLLILCTIYEILQYI